MNSNNIEYKKIGWINKRPFSKELFSIDKCLLKSHILYISNKNMTSKKNMYIIQGIFLFLFIK